MDNFNLGNHDPSSLEPDCPEPGTFAEVPMLGPASLNCPTDTASPIPNFGWSSNDTHGQHANCDPMQAGKIRNDPEDSDPEVIHRFANGIRGTNEAMVDLFKGIEVLDDNGAYHPVPIVWATQERAVAYVLQDNIDREDLTVRRLRLPLLAIHYTSINPDWNRYIYHQNIQWFKHLRPDNKPAFTVAENGHPRGTVLGYAMGIPVDITYRLIGWSLYQQDIETIMSQIFLRVGRMTQLKVNGVVPLINVTLDGTDTNINTEPGEGKRIIKYSANLTAKAWIPQPIKRTKAVTKILTSISNSPDKQKFDEVYSRIIAEVEQNE